MNKIKVIFLFFIAAFCTNAQTVTIKGNAPSYQYKEIAVWLTNDYISNTQRQITYSVIDSLGNFLLEFNTKDIQYITLKIEKNIASMYAEPNANYEIKIAAPDSITYQNPNTEHDVEISINIKSRTEINSLTMDYDKRFDNFLGVDYKSFVSRTPHPKIDSFKIAMRNFYSTVNNKYLDRKSVV